MAQFNSKRLVKQKTIGVQLRKSDSCVLSQRGCGEKGGCTAQVSKAPDGGTTGRMGWVPIEAFLTNESRALNPNALEIELPILGVHDWESGMAVSEEEEGVSPIGE